MAAINWIFNSAIKDLEKSFLLNEEDLMVTWDKIHTKIVLHQETKELHTMSSHGNKIANLFGILQKNLISATVKYSNNISCAFNILRHVEGRQY